MKKLMIGLVGALTMVAGAEVESGNIVGFEERGLAKNSKMITGSNFVTIGEDGLDIQSIKMTGVESDGAFIWWWNTATGKYDMNVNWVEELYDVEENPLGYPGWGDPSTWVGVEKIFAPGESFWIQANKESTVTFSGEVVLIDASSKFCGIDLTKNTKVQVSNPFPGTLDLQSIEMEGVESDGAFIWWWNSTTGKYDGNVNWVEELYDEEENPLGYPGWGDPSTWVGVEKTFDSGDGFWIQANQDATIKFPNPFFVTTP